MKKDTDEDWGGITNAMHTTKPRIINIVRGVLARDAYVRRDLRFGFTRSVSRPARLYFITLNAGDFQKEIRCMLVKQGDGL